MTARATRRTLLGRLPGAVAAVAIGTSLVPACSLGSGSGIVAGTIDAPGCWSGPFNLHPDFFAAIPSSTTAPVTSLSGAPGSDAMQLRIQNGGDFESFSDGIAILLDDAGEVRGDALNGVARPSLLGQPLIVGLSAGVEPAGVPLTADTNPSIVHVSLYLQKTCRTQNVALYALPAVTFEPDGSCNRPAGGDVPLTCPPTGAVTSAGAGASTGADASASASADASAGAEAGEEEGGEAGSPGIGVSTMTFYSLFDGNPDESNAQDRLTDATFDLYLADPRDVCPGGVGPPPRCQGHLTGYFRFYFERGSPAQPFQ